jgi:sigma-B regulation protein RsbU (phosphoserine phosphatase)
MVGVSQDITERKAAQENLEWELQVNSALATLANSLVGLSLPLVEIAEIVLTQARALTRGAHGYVSSIDAKKGDCIIHATSDHSEASGGVSRGQPNGSTSVTVPVMIGRDLVGHVVLAEPESPFTERELAAVKRISEMYALALQRHWMNEDLTQHREDLQGLVERRTSELVTANENLQRLSNAVEQTADSVLITDVDGLIDYVNPAFEETTGYQREEILGQTPRVLKSGKHSADFYQEIWSTLLSGKPWRGTIINRKKNGEVYWAEQTITPMRDYDGNILHFVSVLKDVTEQRKRQEQELQMRLAQEVQQRYYQQALPPRLDGFDIAGLAYPADSVGGDYLDFIPMADGCLGIAVGDVSGHGFGSSLIMAETRAYLRSFAEFEPDVGKILTRVNDAIAADLEDGRFVTMVLARLDPDSRSFVYASAGHVSGYLLDSSGEVVSALESTCCPLGLFQGCEVSSSEVISMQPGHLLVFFTDGIIEAMAPDETEFGVERALDFIRTCLEKPAQEILESVYGTIQKFTEYQPQQDDVTSIICKLDRVA